MNKIFIDVTDLEHWSGNYMGIQRVIYGISKGFYASDERMPRFISYDSEKQRYVLTNPDPIFSKERTHDEGSSRFRARLFKNRVKFSKGDIVLLAGRTWDNPGIHELLRNAKKRHGIKIVQVVYDLIICLQPQLQNPILYDKYARYMREACEISDMLLAISRSTANDLKRFCKEQGVEMPVVQVIRLGEEITQTIALAKTTKKPYGNIKNRFIICVGTIEIRKNQTLLYYAYKLAKSKGIELPQLIIIGRRGWLSDDIQHLIDQDPQTKNDLLILDDVDDEGLAWAYDNCLFSVYPSMYEGWGLPVAESLAYGKMCISSNASSMPEIAGDLIEYFNPYSADECLEKIVEYTNGKALYAKEKKIKEKYRSTTWQQTFEQVTRYLDKL